MILSGRAELCSDFWRSWPEQQAVDRPLQSTPTVQHAGAGGERQILKSPRFKSGEWIPAFAEITAWEAIPTNRAGAPFRRQGDHRGSHGERRASPWVFDPTDNGTRRDSSREPGNTESKKAHDEKRRSLWLPFGLSVWASDSCRG